MEPIESTLYIDPQDRKPACFCPRCGGERYRPSLICLRCELAAAEDPEDIWHLKRRIAVLTPMLTQMNELAELTAHYYDRGYYRSEKYTI